MIPTGDAFDFIVVGAGTAGCVLAARLSEDRALRVCLIEAGGWPDDPDIADPLQWPRLAGRPIDWGFATVAQKGTGGRAHAWPRGRLVGGSSCLNAMAHVRGHPSDFDRWAEAGCAGWGYRDLLPYFIRSETSAWGPSVYHGDSGPLQLITPDRPHPITACYMEAGVAAGVPRIDEHNGPRMAGVTLNTLTILNGRRQSAADAYLAPALERPNLSVMTGAQVQCLLFDEASACRGVSARVSGGARKLFADRGVILSAGAIGSPALLMRSGIGPADELRALGIAARVDLSGVGGNLHDHLLAGGNVYRAKRPVPTSRYQHSESLMYVARSPGPAAPELVLACVVLPVATERFTAPSPGEAYTVMFGFTHPKSRGRLRLRSADPDDPPIIDPGYLADPYDREAFGAALDLAREIGHSAALDEWRGSELLPVGPLGTAADRQAFLESAAHTHHHPVGTCAMGVGTDAVVDSDLSVRGTRRLYVVDASVMPRITTGPVNAAIVAIAERASDLLRGRTPFPPAMLPSAGRFVGP